MNFPHTPLVMREFLVFVACIALLGILVGAVLIGYDRASCLARWEQSHYEVRWSIVGGCQLQRADGSWVPASSIAIRVLEGN